MVATRNKEKVQLIWVLRYKIICTVFSIKEGSGKHGSWYRTLVIIWASWYAGGGGGISRIICGVGVLGSGCRDSTTNGGCVGGCGGIISKISYIRHETQHLANWNNMTIWSNE